MSETIRAVYLIETPFPVEQAAETLAGEQSSGTFLPIPGETEELRARSRAKVEKITLLESRDTPSLPGARIPKGLTGQPRFQQAEVVIAFPLDNLGPKLSTLTATVTGNLFELSEFSGLRLRDVELPPAFGDVYPGPQFGIEGTQNLAGVSERPILGTIIKPSVGLTPQQTAELVRELGEAGIDFIKDDELMANAPHSPFEERVAAVMRVINELADRTGKKIMFAFNISDDIEAMLRHHDTVLEAGGTCVMVNLNSMGVPAVTYLRTRCQLPIHGHRNGWGMLTRCPALGIEFPFYQKLWRLAGIDHLHVNGLKNKFWEPDDSVVRSIESCLAPFLGKKPLMPVLSSGQSVVQPPETYRRTGTTDVMYLAGGGIMAHPGGPGAGLVAIRQAWEAAVEGVPLDDYAATRPELRQALEKYR